LEQANRARFRIGVLQLGASIALCLRRRRFAVAEAGQKRNARRRSASIWRIPVKIDAKIVDHGRYVAF